ncbi:squalene monooxygenase [Tothia fuscella]|uniref:Squalene monooxygenase n=1 Tax=Tothia fuscella TaxID=1048955 RepID=A0A9P4NPK3_9PEZI|nr:squalene monooxygenase [Tothia fuscella]
METCEEQILQSNTSAIELRNEADVIIVGAGVFGSAMATTLARQSRSVLLLERDLAEPNRIVGELMQPGGVEAPETLDLDSCLDGIDAIPVRGEGRSFHHGRFIQNLKAVARAQPNIRLIETEVSEAIYDDTNLQVVGVRDKRKGSYFAPLTIVADGFNSRFRKRYLNLKPTCASSFWALELKDSPLQYPEHGHVFLTGSSLILSYQIGTHETRVLIDVPQSLNIRTPSQVKAQIQNNVLPTLPLDLRESIQKALAETGLKSMPSSFLPTSSNRVPGLLIVGDAMNMRHPLTGGGMMVALNDACHLRSLLSPFITPNFGDTKLVSKQVRRFHWQRKRSASVVNVLAGALYALFAAEDIYFVALQRGCFEYFLQGGACTDGPAGLLAGLIKNPFVLFSHFFSVAWLSIRLHLSLQPAHRLPYLLFECGMIWLTACTVLFPLLASEMRDLWY